MLFKSNRKYYSFYSYTAWSRWWKDQGRGRGVSKTPDGFTLENYYFLILHSAFTKGLPLPPSPGKLNYLFTSRHPGKTAQRLEVHMYTWYYIHHVHVALLFCMKEIAWFGENTYLVLNEVLHLISCNNVYLYQKNICVFSKARIPIYKLSSEDVFPLDSPFNLVYHADRSRTKIL